MVVPAAARSRISSQNSRRASGSKPVVGSSRKSSSGSADDAQRHVQAALLPAGEGVRPGLRLVGQPDPLDHLVRVVGVGVEAGEVPDHLGHRQLVELAGALQHDADPGPPVGVRVGRVDAEHGDLAGVPVPVTLQDLHRGGLAGAVRAEQREHLATVHVEIHARHRHVVAVRLAQPSDGDRQLVIHGVQCAPDQRCLVPRVWRSAPLRPLCTRTSPTWTCVVFHNPFY